MLSLYFVKKPLFGMPAGSLDQFQPTAAAVLVADGSIEPFDEKVKAHKAALEAVERVRFAAAARTKKLQDEQRELHRRQFGSAA